MDSCKSVCLVGCKLNTFRIGNRKDQDFRLYIGKTTAQLISLKL